MSTEYSPEGLELTAKWLRINRSIQAEGPFGIVKQDRGYRIIRRRGLEKVKLEFLLVAIGHNLYKFHNKHKRLQAAA